MCMAITVEIIVATYEAELESFSYHECQVPKLVLNQLFGNQNDIPLTQHFK